MYKANWPRLLVIAVCLGLVCAVVVGILKSWLGITIPSLIATFVAGGVASFVGTRIDARLSNRQQDSQSSH